MNRLAEIVMDTRPEKALWMSVDSGEMLALFPEFMGLSTKDGRHKDMLAHSIRVAAKTPARLELRVAALTHDIGKPATRKFEGSKVTFWMHEDVGARMLEKTLPHLGFSPLQTDRIARMVRMSGDVKQAELWSDAAVRRFIVGAGDCLDDLLWLFRADTTSKHAARRRMIAQKTDALRVRIAEVQALDAKRAERPVLSGSDLMAMFGLEQGPNIGKALKLIEGVTDRDDAIAIISEWQGRGAA